MDTQTETETENATQTQFVARSAIKILNAKTFPVGSKVSGVLQEKRERMVTDKRTGELKTITDLVFKSVTDSSLFAIPQDAGLRVALSEFNIKMGEHILVEKLPQIQWNGNALNQYSILVAE